MEQSYGNLGWQYFVIAAYVLSGITLAATAFIAYRQHKIAIESLREEGDTPNAN